jgi:hypothetical protein
VWQYRGPQRLHSIQMRLPAIARLLLVPAMSLFGTAHSTAQVLTPPPLASDEFLVNTVTGCAVVGYWSEDFARRTGWARAAIEADLAHTHVDKVCRPGELLTGRYGTVSEFVGRKPADGLWYHFGRVFGVNEATASAPWVTVVWERRRAVFPVDIDTPEKFEQQLKEGPVSVTVIDGPGRTEVKVSFNEDDYSLPKSKRRYEVTVVTDMDRRRHPCPPPEDARSCFALWQQHASAVQKQAMDFLAEIRPKIEALREAVSAHVLGSRQ